MSTVAVVSPACAEKALKDSCANKTWTTVLHHPATMVAAALMVSIGSGASVLAVLLGLTAESTWTSVLQIHVPRAAPAWMPSETLSAAVNLAAQANAVMSCLSLQPHTSPANGKASCTQRRVDGKKTALSAAAILEP